MVEPTRTWKAGEFIKSIWQKIADKFKSAPAGQVVQPCGKAITPNPTRAAIPAFAKDANGNILGNKVGEPFLTSHGGFVDPVTGQVTAYFAAQAYELRLADGRKVTAMKSLGRYDPVAQQIVPDSRMDTDCHGLTFTNGEFWIDDPEVDKILYHEYRVTSQPQPGDILIYRDANGSVVHSVTVTQVGADGNVTEVSGLGGIQPAEHTSTPDAGWFDPNASKTYYTK
jgi:hypothetical protein